MTAIHLTDGNPDGTYLGQNSSDPIGFFGTTPVAKTTVAGISAVTAAVISQVGTSSKWAFSTSTAAKATANAMVALKKLGLI